MIAERPWTTWDTVMGYIIGHTAVPMFPVMEFKDRICHWIWFHYRWVYWPPMMLVKMIFFPLTIYYRIPWMVLYAWKFMTREKEICE